ncbi:hypothetical protein ABB37_07842 [Leptomonas pyrrhocoris]|uniref:FYVE-type domain-containing protein n=1 Tax=Leptomonas pyrrhocoris TaxID=157538 RepID=A0A0N0VDU3_LEPPY|nr:hypothetical protein ABB37_07842 [Leptomonas pyrrhocoris]KPA76552.1 hypothetical protein ABB37_07842 [Leptomonas pyrrhocoris]|eukprot:XP_015654991.1 hypothetical protein ABB37_07842 [Leptomonas pyrrhocoris]
MVSLFGLTKDKKEKKKAEEEQEESTPVADQPPPPPQGGDEAAGQQDGGIASVHHSSDNVADEASPSAAPHNNDATTPVSGQVAESVSSESSEHEKKEGVSRYVSSYEGSADGRCQTCNLLKIACNCQRCFRCHRYLLTLSSRRHCRRCWRAVCPKCSPFERTNDFLRGEMSRTCKECAVPHALVYVTQLANSSYETLNAGAKLNTQGDSEDGSNEAAADVHPHAHPLDTRPFRWGLYLLSCEMDAPRRCINPSCSNPISYDLVCAKCKVVTVTLAAHQLRHVEVADRTDMAASSGDKSAAVITEAVENAVRLEYDSVSAARTTAEEDAIFDAALPNESDSYLFANLQGDSWSSRKVLLSLVACAIAAEASAMPNISLAMMDTPPYAQLLRPVQVSEVFSVFDAPGHVRFIAFNSGASSRSSIHQVLGTHMTACEAWTSSAMKKSNAVAKVVSTSHEAHAARLTECVAKLNVREGVLAYIAESDVLRKLPEMVDKTAKEGSDVVLCGHGIGGAVASWISATLLLESTADLKDRLMCVTFGAPLVANHALTDLLSQHELHKNFQHFVNGSDMVPRMSYIDALLESGNTVGTASIVGHGERVASAVEVREAVVMWVGRHEEPLRVSAPQLRTGKEGFSISSVARRMRSVNVSDSKSKKSKSAEEGEAASVAEDGAGDLFRTSREPFDNNIIRAVDENTALTLHDVDFQRFVAPEHRAKQAMDPFGCYHFLWHTRGRYICTDDPSTSIGFLSDRTDLRVQLQDHLLSSYNKAMVEYIYSISPGQ